MKRSFLHAFLFLLIAGLAYDIVPHAFADNWYGWWGQSSSTRRKIDKLDDDEVEDLKIPVLLGVDVDDLDDTWGDARSNGRTHEGIDIFVPRGAFIVSPTEAVVTNIEEGGLGGKVVYTANPGGETYYYAHLDDWADDLDEGDELDPGDLIGYVGNTGNASGGSTHLHFTIYTEDGAENPFPRLTETFDLDERIDAIDQILDDADSDDEDEIAENLVATYRGLFLEAQKEEIDLPSAIEDAMGDNGVPAVSGSTTNILTRTLMYGMTGEDIKWFQTFLMNENAGTSARALTDAGATGYFGTLTKSAAIEYQRSVGLVADGVIGPMTRAAIDASLLK